jgi:FkbM family methyltransferase
VLDVGANSGQFARKARVVFPNSALYSFEPLPVPFAALDRWAKSNGTTAFQYAVGAVDGRIEMCVHNEHSPSSSVLQTTAIKGRLYPQTQAQSVIQVEQRRLDGLLAATFPHLEDEVLLKLDVQGYEDRVLDGAGELLKRVAACIIEANVEQLYVGQAPFHGLVARLAAAGLFYSGNLEQTCAPDGRLLFLDALFLRQTRQGA